MRRGLAREASLPPSHYVLDHGFCYYFSFFRPMLFHLLAIFSRSFTLASDITDTRSIINCFMFDVLCTWRLGKAMPSRPIV